MFSLNYCFCFVSFTLFALAPGVCHQIALPLNADDDGAGNNIGATAGECNSSNSSGNSSARSSTDASMSSEVDDVLSRLCKNMLLLNQEQQQSTNGQSARNGCRRNNYFDLGEGSAAPPEDLLMTANTMTSRTRSGNCFLSIASVSDPGPVLPSASYSNVAADFNRMASHQGGGGGGSAMDTEVNVDWSIFDTTTAATTSPQRSSSGRELPGESHSKSVPNLHNCSLSHACKLFL